MKKIFFLLLPALLFSEDLKSLLEVAKQNNNLIHASTITIQSKAKELEAIKSNYYPTIDVKAFYERDDAPTPFYPGTTYGAAAKISLDIYDGGKRSYSKKEKENGLKAATFSHKQNIKALFLSISKTFFNLKTLTASLLAREEASKAVEAQLHRVKEFYAANLATSDDVNRLEAAYERNLYDIESLKFKILSLKKSLELQVGRDISKLSDSHFKKVSTQQENELDSIRELRYNKRAMQNASRTIKSYYYPTIKISDSYTFFGYANRPYFAGEPIPLLDYQNNVSASLTLRLFDFGALKEQTEAVKLQADAINEQIIYQSKKQKMEVELAQKRIESARLNIQSSKSALKAATSALKTITQKYQAGIVDNVTYLDALSSHTEAKALYEKSRNDLEIAYAIYYYYNAKNLEEFLK
jgi:outer membrane protein TolC